LFALLVHVNQFFVVPMTKNKNQNKTLDYYLQRLLEKCEKDKKHLNTDSFLFVVYAFSAKEKVSDRLLTMIEEDRDLSDILIKSLEFSVFNEEILFCLDKIELNTQLERQVVYLFRVSCLISLDKIDEVEQLFKVDFNLHGILLLWKNGLILLFDIVKNRLEGENLEKFFHKIKNQGYKGSPFHFFCLTYGRYIDKESIDLIVKYIEEQIQICNSLRTKFKYFEKEYIPCCKKLFSFYQKQREQLEIKNPDSPKLPKLNEKIIALSREIKKINKTQN
jgi:hypothetical protein